jgi:hypothetical protein
MTLRIAMIALAALGGVALASGKASAMPKGIPLADQIAGQSLNIEQARYVCNEWGRCSWRPNWYGAYGYYRPHPWRWHRWHRYS